MRSWKTARTTHSSSDLIADKGLWTDHPATNFVTVTFDPEAGPSHPRAAGSAGCPGVSRRADRLRPVPRPPVQPWKQADFRGLAAFFGGVHSNLRGIRDGENDYKPPDRKTKEPVKVEPRVPFCPELRARQREIRANSSPPGSSTRGTQISPARRSTASGPCFSAGRWPSRSTTCTAAGELHPALGLLADDFAAHGYDLHRLIRTIAATEVFRLDSAVAETPSEAQEEAWAVFPMTRLRPEQVAGALFQCASLTTLGPQSHWFIRTDHLYRPQRFRPPLRRHRRRRVRRARRHDPPAALADERRDRSRQDQETTSSPPRAGSPISLPTTARPSKPPTWPSSPAGPRPEEESHFMARLAGARTEQERKDRLTDLFWALINTTEFSWNH